MTSQERPRKKYANSSAKTDCHRCDERQRACDRQRPRCGQCAAENSICSGYSQELSWLGIYGRRQAHQNAKPAQQAIATESIQTVRNQADVQEHRPRSSWRFVNNAHLPKKRKKRKPNPSLQELSTVIRAFSPVERPCTRMSQMTWSFLDNDPLVLPDNARAIPDIADAEALRVLLPAQNESRQAVDLLSTTNDAHAGVQEQQPTSTQPAVHTEQGSTPPSPSLDVASERICEVRDLLQHETDALEGQEPFESVKTWSRNMALAMNSTMRDPTFPLAWQELLHNYKTDYCGTPVTTDFVDNPYRYALKLVSSSPAVLHAILSFSAHHHGQLIRKSDQVTVLYHKSASMTHLNEALISLSDMRDSPVPLTTMILLISLDVTQSGNGAWESHLRAAAKLLEQRDIPALLATDMQLRGQTAMLVWWDLTLAMITRKTPILPKIYEDRVIASASAGIDLDFFNLVGCQDDIFALLAKIVRIVPEQRAGGDIFDIVVQVQEIEEQLLSWQLSADYHPKRVRALQGRQLEYTMNRIHATEAWRWALLLYIQQIFRGGRTSDYYRLQVFRHAQSITRNAQDRIQKQILLPLFLAGAQTTSDEQQLRDEAINMCEYWSDAARFGQFGTVADLLRCIWDKMDASEEPLFWGDVLDKLGGSYLMG